MKKRFLSLALALALCLGLAAPALADDGDFTIVNGGTLTRYYGPGGDVVIPDGVTEIYEYTFGDCKELTSVTIPDGVTSIGKAAFQRCTGLTSVTIPDSVTSIGSMAFFYCEKLTGVTIPNGVVSIGDDAFSGCYALNDLTISDSVTSIGDYAFNYCNSLTDVYYGGSEAQWKAITIGKDNDKLTGATIHYSGSAAADPAPATPATPATPTTPAPAASSFNDVKEGDYFAQPVAWAVENKVTNGTSADTFSPNQTCTVAQILTFLSRAKGSPEPAGTASLPGVDTGAYYYKPAAWALEQGLTDNFSADAPCTRSMVVTYLWKLAGSPAAEAGGFSDVPAGADCAQAVAWAVEQGITNGTSATTFSPDATCTRGQIVTFLHRAFVK